MRSTCLQIFAYVRFLRVSLLFVFTADSVLSRVIADSVFSRVIADSMLTRVLLHTFLVVNCLFAKRVCFYAHLNTSCV